MRGGPSILDKKKEKKLDIDSQAIIGRIDDIKKRLDQVIWRALLSDIPHLHFWLDSGRGV